MNFTNLPHTGGIFQSGHNGYNLTEGGNVSVGCYAKLPYSAEMVRLSCSYNKQICQFRIVI